MNKKLRDTIKKEIATQGRTQVDVAKALGWPKQMLHEMLNKLTKFNIPQTWIKLLDYLGLEFAIKKKEPEPSDKNNDHDVS